MLELVPVPCRLVRAQGQTLYAPDQEQASPGPPPLQHLSVRLQQRLYALDGVEKAEVRDERDAVQAGDQTRQPLRDGGLGVGVRREEDVAPGEKEAVLAIPEAVVLPPGLQSLDDTRRDATRLPLPPPAVLVHRRHQRDATTGSAQERRQEEDGTLGTLGSRGVLDVDHVGLLAAHGALEGRQAGEPQPSTMPFTLGSFESRAASLVVSTTEETPRWSRAERRRRT